MTNFQLGDTVRWSLLPDRILTITAFSFRGDDEQVASVREADKPYAVQAWVPTEELEPAAPVTYAMVDDVIDAHLRRQLDNPNRLR